MVDMWKRNHVIDDGGYVEKDCVIDDAGYVEKDSYN